jgi:hypothetical protein
MRRSRELRVSTKLKILNINMKSELLYGSETWRETSSMESVQVREQQFNPSVHQFSRIINTIIKPIHAHNNSIYYPIYYIN